MPLLTKGLVWSGGLIALYLLLANATNAGTLLTSAKGAYVDGVTVLQGR